MSRARSLPLWVAVAALWVSSTAMAQNQARLYGYITDENGKPVPGVQLMVTCASLPEFSFTTVSDAKGKWVAVVIDAIKTYTYSFTKDGFQGMKQDLKAPTGTNERHDFVLLSLAELRKRGGVPAAQELTLEEKAVVAFNEGAEASQIGDLATAKQKMVEASTLDPQLTVAHSALAGLLYGDKEYAGALSAAEKALALDPRDARALRVAVEAHTALGNTAQAKAASAALAAVDPKAGALDLFNQGVREYNAGAMPAALKLFEESLAADPGFGKTHYMLGMCYISKGDNAKAKLHLESFIAVADADDADAATAKEMLSYLK